MGRGGADHQTAALLADAPKLGDGAKVAAQSGIMTDLEPGVVMMGSPARPQREWLRIHAALAKLPEVMKRLRELEKQMGKAEDES